MEMPPMPVPEDFRDLWGDMSQVAYGEALRSWERVAKHLIDRAHPAPVSVPSEETPR